MPNGDKKLFETTTQRQISRRAFVKSLAYTGVGLGGDLLGSVSAQIVDPPVPVKSINHMTISVSDPEASLAWYLVRDVDRCKAGKYSCFASG